MLIECVPNFSEGRDPEVLQAIVNAIRSVTNIHFLGMDSGVATHRTVMTFCGPPAAVCEAAFLAMEVASQRIDMRKHIGVHPRIGATDVCPLIPLQGIARQQVVALSHQLGRRVGETLNIPVYLYGYATQSPQRRQLAQIRKGGYEGLAKKLGIKGGAPDFGPNRFQPGVGATVIGVRDLMIAYNINLPPGQLRLAKAIAAEIRESGRKTKNGQSPGIFKGLKAIGWTLPEEALTQVSTNIMDLNAAPIHLVFETVKALAQQGGCALQGSELIGLMPRQAFIDAGEFFKKQNPAKHESMSQAAIDGLGLNRVKSFSPQKHILENCLNLAQNLLISNSLDPTIPNQERPS